jgi:cobalamin biosynthesis protein CbiG
MSDRSCPQYTSASPKPVIGGAGHIVCRMSDASPSPASAAPETPGAPGFDDLTRDIADVPAVEVITTVAVHLMSAAAVNLGLAEEGAEHKDLDEARKLIQALAGLVTASATEISSFHAAPLRDGLKSLQLAFREASLVPDEQGQGPGEKYTGPIYG